MDKKKPIKRKKSHDSEENDNTNDKEKEKKVNEKVKKNIFRSQHKDITLDVSYNKESIQYNTLQ